MTSSELMIGDWVRPLKKAMGGRACRVITIDGGTGLVWIDNEDFSGLLPASDIERIPLTPEILEKNGFRRIESETTSLAETWGWHEKVAGRIYDKSVGITFYNEPINGVSHLTKIETCSQKDDGVDNIHSCDIDSVHELQHALKLCGIEKEIVV